MFARIDSYTPRIPDDEWEAIGDLVREAVMLSSPRTEGAAKRRLLIARHFIRWRWLLGEPLDGKSQFTPHKVDDFIKSGEHPLTGGSLATLRSDLMRICEAYDPLLVRVPEPRRRHVLANADYSEDELKRLRRWAGEQSTPYRRRNATLLLALGAGAGLVTGELRILRTDDLILDGEKIDVVIRGERARRVPVLPKWVRPIREAAEHNGPGALVFSPLRNESNTNFVAHFVAHCTAVEPAVSFVRLRTTWILHHLRAGVPIDVLFPATGLTSLSHFHQYLALLGERDAAECEQWLRCRGE